MVALGNTAVLVISQHSPSLPHVNPYKWGSVTEEQEAAAADILTQAGLIFNTDFKVFVFKYIID